MIQKAWDNGLSQFEAKEPSDLFYEFRNIFHTSFSVGPPANIDPLQIDLTQDAKPVSIQLRNYTQDQRYISVKIDKCTSINRAHISQPNIKMGICTFTRTETWTCMFRFTLDLRPVNKHTIKYQYPMPRVEEQFSKLQESECYCEVDFTHCYWQLPLHSDSHEQLSIITPDSILSPARVLHETTNPTVHTQTQLSKCIRPELHKQILGWVDDVLLHSKSFRKLLNSMPMMFLMLNFNPQPTKCILFTK